MFCQTAIQIWLWSKSKFGIPKEGRFGALVSANKCFSKQDGIEPYSLFVKFEIFLIHEWREYLWKLFIFVDYSEVLRSLCEEGNIDTDEAERVMKEYDIDYTECMGQVRGTSCLSLKGARNYTINFIVNYATLCNVIDRRMSDSDELYNILTNQKRLNFYWRFHNNIVSCFVTGNWRV